VNACMVYPFTGAAAYARSDYRWMYPGILLAPLYFIVAACLHASTGDGKRALSRVALGFALISATVISTDYFIQIEVMQPSLLRGETDGIALFSQYNPHGIFIALEDLGYLAMSAAFLFEGAVFATGRGIERGLRWTLLIASTLALAAYPGLALIYRTNLEYRFEVTVITVNWTTLVVTGVLMSIWFHSGAQEEPA